MRTRWDRKLLRLVGAAGRHQTELVVRASGATALRKGYVGEPNTVRIGRTLAPAELAALRSRLDVVRTAGHYGDEPDHHVHLAYYADRTRYETTLAWSVEMGARIWGRTRPPASLEALVDELLALRDSL